MSIQVEKRELVVPGQVLATGMDHLPGTGAFRDGDNVRSKYLGIVGIRNDRLLKVLPMSGKYLPATGDLIIGSITRVSYSNWTVETNSAYDAILPVSEGTRDYVDLQEDDIADYYDIGDVIAAKVTKVTKGKDIQITMKDSLCRKLEGGRVVSIPATKVPRVIGKKGTMVNTIKQGTDCTIMVGQNGRIWVKGGNEKLAIEAIKLVSREAHTHGLTDRVKELLEQGVN